MSRLDGRPLRVPEPTLSRLQVCDRRTRPGHPDQRRRRHVGAGLREARGSVRRLHRRLPKRTEAPMNQTTEPYFTICVLLDDHHDAMIEAKKTLEKDYLNPPKNTPSIA